MKGRKDDHISDASMIKEVHLQRNVLPPFKYMPITNNVYNHRMNFNNMRSTSSKLNQMVDGITMEKWIDALIELCSCIFSTFLSL